MRPPRAKDKDTICSLATPPGLGALALIRISGPKAWALTKKLCPFVKNTLSHRIYFGTLRNFVTKKKVDEVLVSYFKKGRSFTGEECIEISCHGGSFIASSILDLLVRTGMRIADKGEFSYRAFMNGKIDLIQAESVLSLIQSKSSTAHAQALQALKGKTSKYLKILETQLLELLAHVEASIDFTQHDIKTHSLHQQKKLILQIEQKLLLAKESFKQGVRNYEGFNIVLLGDTNTGKSTLFNTFLQEDRAIVTNQPGTTRDILSASFLLGQQEFLLQDTAGLRTHPGVIEKKGITKALKASKTCDVCLFLIDSSTAKFSQNFHHLEKALLDKTIVIFSKSDKLPLKKRKAFLKKITKQCTLFSHSLMKPLFISSHTGEGMRDLKKALCKLASGDEGDVFFFTKRQGEALDKMYQFLSLARKLLAKNASEEFIALELQSALTVLYELLGKSYNEAVIKHIFKSFCIGK